MIVDNDYPLILASTPGNSLNNNVLVKRPPGWPMAQQTALLLSSWGEDSRDLFLTRVNCSDTVKPVEPSTCVACEGCDEGYPVHWCVHNGNHLIPNWAADAAWEFFSQF